MSLIIDRQGQPLHTDPLAGLPRHPYDDGTSLTKPLAPPYVLVLANTLDVAALDMTTVTGAHGIELQFPAFTDGRAYSQARDLRRRGYTGELRATGDVLADQLLIMRRCGFSSFALAEGVALDTAQRALQAFNVRLQGSVDDEGLHGRATA